MNNRNISLYIVLFLNSVIFLAELIISLRTGSVALKADAFHVLSDIVATIISIYSISIAKRDKTPHATFGWLRSEVIGGLSNCIFLLALGFNILIEAIERLTDIDEIKETLSNGIDEVLIVGCVGLAVNFISLIVVHYGDHGHDHNNNEMRSYISVSSSIDKVDDSNDIDITKNKKKKGVNTRGLWLHIIGDILGSIVVIISSITIKFANGDFKYYLDPSVSLITVAIIFIITYPLLIKCRRILLHHVPKSIDMIELKKEIKNIETISNIHELHIWQLDDVRLIGSIHFKLNKVYEDKLAETLRQTSKQINSIFHKYGVHSTTLQPEFYIESKAETQLGFKDIDLSDMKISEHSEDVILDMEDNCISIICNDDCRKKRCCK
jgi:zinc transporter 1